MTHYNESTTHRAKVTTVGAGKEGIYLPSSLVAQMGLIRGDHLLIEVQDPDEFVARVERTADMGREDVAEQGLAKALKAAGATVESVEVGFEDGRLTLKASGVVRDA